MVFVELVQKAQHLLPHFFRHVPGRVEVRHPWLAGTDDRALVKRWQPAARPVVRALDGQPTRIGQNTICRQVLAFASQRVGDPRSQCRPACVNPARVERKDRLIVVVDASLHRSHERDLVGNRAEMRQEIAQFDARAPARAKCPRAAEELGARLAGIVKLDRAGEALAMTARKLGLGIEQVNMAGPALHEERDHRRRPGRLGRNLGLQIIDRRLEDRLQGRGAHSVLLHEPCQSERADTHALARQEVAPRQRSRRPGRWHGDPPNQLTYKNAFELRIAWQRPASALCAGSDFWSADAANS